MRRIKLSLFAVAVLLFAGCAQTFAQSNEEEAIRQTIRHYFQGHATGVGEHFRKAFQADAKLFSMRDGKLAQLTLEEYIARAPGKPAADEAQRKRKIESIDVAGNAAVVKVVLDYPSALITDYMSMLKIEGEWKIVNKTFFINPKPRS